MKIGIMQPYIFPYIGYFQLISAVDRFVIHDDVQWIKGGWINRNRILVQGKPKYFTLPLQKSSTLLNINKREFPDDIDAKKQKIIRQIEGAYRKAPRFDAIIHLISRCFTCNDKNVSAFIANSIKECCSYIGINTTIHMSSDIDKDNSLNGQSRVVNICSVLSASQYINPIGGTNIYSKKDFELENITLKFLRSRNIRYKQFNNEFVPHLSIIDLLMFCSIEEIQALLREYDLV